MYKLIESTGKGQVVITSGWKANLQNEAIISLNPLIVIEETKEGIYLIGKKLEGEIFDWVNPKELIKNVSNVVCTKGGFHYTLGFDTEEIFFEVKQEFARVVDICEELEIEVKKGCVVCFDYDNDILVPFEEYEPSEEEVQDYIKILGYEYVEL